LGLYLAYTTPCKVSLTDISELNVDEYQAMWKALNPPAKGDAEFSLQDARALQFKDAEFEIVYSTSVLEHIEGDLGDSKATQEMLRVSKPGGLLILSVPSGPRYIEQQKIGFAAPFAALPTGRPIFSSGFMTSLRANAGLGANSVPSNKPPS
jgi:ubiquinone/menaquinone biosynthesis C-methylase UbiE